MRLVIARCSVDYSGRLDAHLPAATRLAGGRTDFGLRGTVDLDTLEIDLYADGALGFEALNVLSPYWGTGGVADLELRVYGGGSDLAYQGFADLRDERSRMRAWLGWGRSRSLTPSAVNASSRAPEAAAWR